MKKDTFGFLTNKKHRDWAMAIDSYVEHGIKKIRLNPETFEWAREKLGHPENIKEFLYRDAEIIKINK